MFFPTIVFAANITGSYKYAWSNQVGYINFENVTVGNNSLSGYAWSQNAGWINFSPANGGVLNNNGDLSGYAWGENLGWINFNNVSINTSNGKFSGTASGDVIGTLTFDCVNYCDVRTDWRPPVTQNGGGSGGGGNPAPSAPMSPASPTAPTSPSDPTSTSESNSPTISENQPGRESGTTIASVVQKIADVFKGDPASETQMSAAAVITNFLSNLQTRPSTNRSGDDYVESFNTPLTVEPKQRGLLVWNFTTPRMAEESKKEAVIIELPREVIDDTLTISVKRVSDASAIKDGKTSVLGTVFNIIATDKEGRGVHQFKNPIKVILIIPENLRGKKDLGVYSLSEGNNSWVHIPDVTFDDSSATFYTNHLSHFAIFIAAENPEIISVSSPTAYSNKWAYAMIVIIFILVCLIYYQERKKTKKHNNLKI